MAVSFNKAGGAPGTNGTNGVGTAGANGNGVRSGTTSPGAGLGIDGDFYIDTVLNLIYGPKTAGAWGTGAPMRGPAGADGTGGSGGGSVENTTRVVTASANILTSDKFVFFTGAGASILTLPQATGTDGLRVTVKRVGIGSLSIAGFGAEQVEGSASIALSQVGESVSLTSINGAWFVC